MNTQASQQWAAFERYRRRHRHAVKGEKWVAVRGETVLGVFASFGAGATKLRETRKGTEALGAVYRGNAVPIHLTLAMVKR